MISKDFAKTIDHQKKRSVNIFIAFIFFTVLTIIYNFRYFYISLNDDYQAARNNLLLVTDTVLVSNENVMYQLFGEKRKQDMQRRQELARRFRMAR